MELKELRSLVALAELGSITRTAERLHVTPAAIHKQLKVVEQELGIRLYEKIGRRLQLTQATEVLLPYVKALLAQYDSALSALEEWKGMRRGLVRIGSGHTLSSFVLPVLLKKFRRAYPDVELFVETGNTPVLLSGLENGSLDLSLIVSADLVESPGVTVEANWDFELVLVSHQPHGARRCRLRDLSRLPFILFRKGSRMQDPIDRYFAAHDFHPRVIMRFDNAEAIRAMIRTGLGIGVLPVWIVDEDLKQRRLELIQQQEPPLLSRIALVSRKSSYVARAVRSFIEMAQQIDWKTPRMTIRPRREAQLVVGSG